MNIDEIIGLIDAAERGSREFDAAIALLTGWRNEVVVEPDTQTGEMRRRGIWRHPISGQEEKVPNYTTDIGAAHTLVEMVAAGERCGCSWEPGLASARVGGGPYVQSTDPALALCLALLGHMRYHRMEQRVMNV